MDKFLIEPWPVSSQPKSFQNHLKKLHQQNQTELTSALNRAKINETLDKVNKLLNSTVETKLPAQTQLSTSPTEIVIPEFILSDSKNLKYINQDMTEKQAKLKSSLDLALQQTKLPFSSKAKKYIDVISSTIEIQNKSIVEKEDETVGNEIDQYILGKLKEDLSLQDFRYLCLIHKLSEGKPAKLDSVLYRDQVD